MYIAKQLYYKSDFETQSISEFWSIASYANLCFVPSYSYTSCENKLDSYT